jgi:glycosyltransferase involved in cell wall biosynthesis
MAIRDRYMSTSRAVFAPTGVPRVVVVAQRLPWPPRGGGDLRIAQLVSVLESMAEVGVAALAPVERSALPAPPGVLARAPQAALDPRAQALAALRWIRDPGGLPTDRWWTAEAQATVHGLLAEMRPHVVVLAHLWTHRALDAAREAGARVVLDEHNVEASLHEELAERTNGGQVATRLTERIHAIEGRMTRSVDRVWACSSEDAAGLVRRYPSCAPVSVVPNGVDSPGPLPPRAPPDGRPTVLFPGSFGYPPNARAARWLIDHLLPVLRVRGTEAHLLLAGSDPPSELVEATRDNPDVHVTGAVEDMGPHFRDATAVVVPLVDGGGTRYKVLEAFAAGTPVVSTAKGIEGIDAVPGRDYLPAESAEEFADAIAQLGSPDGDLRATLAASAHRLVAERYSRPAVATAVAAGLAELG